MYANIFADRAGTPKAWNGRSKRKETGKKEQELMIQLSRTEIQALVSIDTGAIEAIRDAYIAVSDGRGDIPPVGYLGFPEKNGDCHIKYGYIAGDPVFVVKIAAGFYDNPAKGLPSSNGIIVAISASTGQIVATLNDEGG
ncbi:hypothetical protein AJ87_09590 [Rhizobium yanglingense]|nr:hypothetical protein AJ87_09590 [Rhizobium yanglingense]